MAPEPNPDFSLPPRPESAGASNPESRLNRVPAWVLPAACREIGIEGDPIAVARCEGIESEALAELCRRAFIRVESAALPRDAMESVRRLWDTLKAIDSPVIRNFAEHSRYSYFRDKTAWRAVFFDHVGRQVPRTSARQHRASSP